MLFTIYKDFNTIMSKKRILNELKDAADLEEKDEKKLEADSTEFKDPVEKVINLIIPKKQLKMITQRPTGALISAVKVKYYKPSKKMLTGKTYQCNLITEMAGM